jgi:hypothetical protein
MGSFDIQLRMRIVAMNVVAGVSPAVKPGVPPGGTGE